MMRTAISLRFVFVHSAAIALLAGCPAKDDDTGGTDTEPVTATATTTQGTTNEPTTTGTGMTTGTDPTTGSDSTTGGTTIDPSSSTTVESSTGEPDDVCACIDPGGFGATSFECGAGACGLLSPDCVPIPDDTGTGSDTGSDTGGDFEDCELVYDEAQLDCAIDLLIAGESGIVKWYYSSDKGFSEYGGFVQMFPGRKGLTHTYDREDIGKHESAAGVVTLKPAAYFEGCKAEPTPAAKSACLKAWSDELPTDQCDPEDSAEDF
jgi:hypothetical protein